MGGQTFWGRHFGVIPYLWGANIAFRGPLMVVYYVFEILSNSTSGLEL